MSNLTCLRLCNLTPEWGIFMTQDIFTNISILVSFLLVIGQVFKKSTFDSKQTLKTQASMGVVFGILGIALMLFTIKMPDNIIIDLRHVAIICAGLMGGPLTAVLAAFIIASARILIFGVSTASIAAFVAALLVSAGTAYISNTKLSRLKKYVFMFIITMLITNVTLINIIKDKNELLEVLAYYWLIYLFGAVLAYFTCEHVISTNANYRAMSYYTMTADNLLDMISTNKPDGRIIFVTPSISQLFGYTPEEFIGTSAYEYIHPEDIAAIKKAQFGLNENADNYTKIFRMRRKDGKYIWVETSVKVIKNDDGSMKEMICVTRDITARKKIEQELRVSNARLKAIFDNAGTGIVIRDCSENLIDVNPAYLEMIGYSREEVNQLSKIVHPEDYESVHKLVNSLVSGECSSDTSEVRYLDKNQQTMHAEVTSTAIPGTEHTPTSIIRIVNNITERKRLEEELKKAKAEADKLAATDFLTGILNRRAFSERFEGEFQRAFREKSSICLMLVDIDHFKDINDVHGHPVGDLALKKVTKCLSDVCRSYDYIGRQGGEEFTVCLPNTELEQGKRIAERMRRAIEELNISFLYLKEPIKITASFGVASCIPKKGESADKLIRQADGAMYKAKEEGRNKVYAACED